ncbi:MAG: tRNA 2-thiouridine(34) synthase MnmA [Terriglobales bacterium]
MSTTVVAMSGGVDSSTAAALLCEAGRDVVGLTMQLWNQRRLGGAPGMTPSASGRCCSLEDVHDARRVARQLGIPFYVVNFEEEFEQTVVRNFVAEYRSGRTPVPCSHCNTAIKFERLHATARQIGAAKVATGHYARVNWSAESGAHELLRARDESKDQTFFLWGLTQAQLACAEFPLGAMTKAEVRACATELGLTVADKPDSNEICFVPSGRYADFLDAYGGEQGQREPASAGELVTPEGRILAVHGGIEQFTIGQRKALGVATGSPLYVLQIDAASRRVTVGTDAELWRRVLHARDCNWISGAPPRGPIRVQARIRHRHTPAWAWAEVTMEGEIGAGVRVEFDEPQRAITPGQSVVLYDGERVLGGGWIERSAA